MLLNCTHKGRAGGSSSSQDPGKRINIHQVSVFMNKRMTADRRQEGAAATSGYISACIRSFIIRTSFDIEIIAFI